jgi:hypothetical protein
MREVRPDLGDVGAAVGPGVDVPASCGISGGDCRGAGTTGTRPLVVGGGALPFTIEKDSSVLACGLVGVVD